MPRPSTLANSLLLAASIVGVVPHDKVVGFNEHAPDLFLKHKPYLKVYHGCVPFLGVDGGGGTA